MAHRAPAGTTLSEEPTACKTMIQDAITQNKLFTETRIPSLYSDFKKLEQINPDGYEANLIAWKLLIQQLFHGGHLSNCFVLDTTGLLDVLLKALPFETIISLFPVEAIATALQSPVPQVQSLGLKVVGKAQPVDIIANTELIPLCVELFANEGSTVGVVNDFEKSMTGW